MMVWGLRGSKGLHTRWMTSYRTSQRMEFYKHATELAGEQRSSSRNPKTL